MKNKKKNQTSQDQKSQDILRDYKKSGKIRPWKKNRLLTEAISSVCYRTPGLEKYGELMDSCGTFLEYMACKTVKHGKKLKRASFCKCRMCVLCQSRRALVVQKKVLDMVGWHREKYLTDVALLLTLTVPNVKGDFLGKSLDDVHGGCQRMMQRKAVKSIVRSSFRATEITYNHDREDYHPHLHMLLMVSPEYFYRKNDLYLIRDEWLRLWQESMRDNSITQVDIRRVDDKGEGTFESIVAEVAKYATKPLSYILKNEKGEFEADPKVVETLHYALKKRRTFAFSGYFKKVWKEKKLQKIEKLDLISVDEEEIDEDGVVKEKAPECCKVCNEPLVKEAYRWDRVAKEYLRVYSDGNKGCDGFQSELKTIQCRGPS